MLGPLRTTLLHPWRVGLGGWTVRQRLSWCSAQAAAGERMGGGGGRVEKEEEEEGRGG